MQTSQLSTGTPADAEAASGVIFLDADRSVPSAVSVGTSNDAPTSTVLDQRTPAENVERSEQAESPIATDSVGQRRDSETPDTASALGTQPGETSSDTADSTLVRPIANEFLATGCSSSMGSSPGSIRKFPKITSV